MHDDSSSCRCDRLPFFCRFGIMERELRNSASDSIPASVNSVLSLKVFNIDRSVGSGEGVRVAAGTGAGPGALAGVGSLAKYEGKA